VSPPPPSDNSPAHEGAAMTFMHPDTLPYMRSVTHHKSLLLYIGSKFLRQRFSWKCHKGHNTVVRSLKIGLLLFNCRCHSNRNWFSGIDTQNQILLIFLWFYAKTKWVFETSETIFGHGSTAKRKFTLAIPTLPVCT